MSATYEPPPPGLRRLWWSYRCRTDLPHAYVVPVGCALILTVNVVVFGGTGWVPGTSWIAAPVMLISTMSFGAQAMYWWLWSKSFGLVKTRCNTCGAVWFSYGPASMRKARVHVAEVHGREVSDADIDHKGELNIDDGG